MTDQMRKDFEAFMRAAKNGELDEAVFDRDSAGDYVLPTVYATFFGWKAATKAERERCAKVCDELGEYWSAYK